MSVNIKTAMEQAMVRMLNTQTTKEPIMEQVKDEAPNLTAEDQNQEIVSERPMINAFTPSVFSLGDSVQGVEGKSQETDPVLAEVASTPEEFTDAIIKVQPQDQFMDTPILSLNLPVAETNTEEAITLDCDFTFSYVEIDWTLFTKAANKTVSSAKKEQTVPVTEPVNFTCDFTFSRVEIEAKEPVAA